MSTSGGSSGGGVSSFNTRTGAVVYDLADAETVYTAAGQLLAGTGSGTGDLLGVGTAGQVLTVGGTDPSGLEWAPGGSGAPGTTVESYATADVTLTSSTSENIASVSLVAGTWLVAGRALCSATAASLTYADIWLGPTSASSTGSYAAGSCELGDIAGAAELQVVTLVKSVILAATTTVYLGGLSPGSVTVKHASFGLSLADCSGITAVRTA